MKKRAKFQIGDKVKITQDTSYHNFVIGSLVTITGKGEWNSSVRQFIYKAKGEKNTSLPHTEWYVREKDMEIIPKMEEIFMTNPIKYRKGDTLRVTADTNNSGFVIGSTITLVSEGRHYNGKIYYDAKGDKNTRDKTLAWVVEQNDVTNEKMTHKYKVGDKVIFVKEGSHCFPVGAVETITGIGNTFQGLVYYRVKGKSNTSDPNWDWNVEENEIELFVDNKQIFSEPKVSSYKGFSVGDLIEINGGYKRIIEVDLFDGYYLVDAKDGHRTTSHEYETLKDLIDFFSPDLVKVAESYKGWTVGEKIKLFGCIRVIEKGSDGKYYFIDPERTTASKRTSAPVGSLKALVDSFEEYMKKIEPLKESLSKTIKSAQQITKDKEIESLKALIGEKNDNIAKLTQQLTDLNVKFDKVSKENTELRNEKNNLKVIVQQLTDLL